MYSLIILARDFWKRGGQDRHIDNIITEMLFIYIYVLSVKVQTKCVVIMYKSCKLCCGMLFSVYLA